MTTSMLLNQVGELNDYDLQVLRDYAIEAPTPWRNVFERLIAAQERDWLERNAAGELEAVMLNRKDVADKLVSLELAAQKLATALTDAHASDHVVSAKLVLDAGKLADDIHEAIAPLLPDPPEEKK